MQTAWDQARLVVLMSIGALIGLTIYSTLSNSITMVPVVYTEVRPVVKFGYKDKKTGRWEAAIQNIYRDDDKACWSLYIEKVSAADVIGYSFFADGGDTSAAIPTAAYAAFDNNSPDKTLVLRNHNVGEQWHRRYCFDVADRIPDFKPITITGKAEHDRPPHLWKTITPIPDFTIAPLTR